MDDPERLNVIPGSATPVRHSGSRAVGRVSTSTYGTADALLDVARGFLDTAPKGRSGKDRSLVVAHVSAESLADRPNVPAGTATTPDYRAGEPFHRHERVQALLRIKLPAQDQQAA